LLVARLFTTPSDSLTVTSRRLLRLGFGVLSVGVVVTGVALLPPSAILPDRWAELPVAPAREALALGWLACLAGIIYVWRNLQPGRVAACSGLVASLAMAYLFGIALPATESYRGERPFAASVREIVGPDSAGLSLYRTRELVYYLGYPGPVTEFDTLADLREAAAEGRVRWVILRRRDLDGLDLPTEVLAEEPTYPWDDAAERMTKAVLLRLRAGQAKSLY
jgi:hypothetical protein